MYFEKFQSKTVFTFCNRGDLEKLKNCNKTTHLKKAGKFEEKFGKHNKNDIEEAFTLSSGNQNTSIQVFSTFVKFSSNLGSDFVVNHPRSLYGNFTVFSTVCINQKPKVLACRIRRLKSVELKASFNFSFT